MVAGPVAGPERRHLAVLVLFGAIAVLQTWPLALHFSSRMVGLAGDGFQTLWHLWLVSRWPQTGQSPLQTTLIFWPSGTTLWTHASNVLNAFWTWPVLATLGPVAAYNTAALGNLVLNAFGAYLLAWRLEGARSPAVLAGLAFGFCAYFSGHLLGHLVLLSAGFIPLGILWTLESLETGRMGRALLAGLAFALNLATLAHVFFLALLAGMAFSWLLVRGPGPGISRLALCRRMIGVGAAAACFSLPFGLALSRELGATQGVVVPREIQRLYSADLLSFLTPSPLHPLLGRFVLPWVESQMGHPPALAEGLVFVGFTVLVLSAVALFAARATTRPAWEFGEKLGPWFWGLVVGASILLALGPELKLGGHPTGLALPFAALARGPGMSSLSAPARFSVLAQLALALLAARGLSFVVARTSASRGRLVTLAAFVLVGLESLWLPYPNTPLPVPSAFLEGLAREGGQGVVVDVPFQTYDPLPMVDQMTHRRPILNGYVSRFPADCFGCLVPPPLSEFHPKAKSREILPPFDLAKAGQPVLRSLGVEYVLVHRDRLDDEQLERALSAVRAMELGPPVYADPRLLAYRVPRRVDTEPFVTSALILGVNFAGGGWSELDPDRPEPARRVSSPEGARILLWATRETRVRLIFPVWKSGPGKFLRLSLNGETCLDERVRPEPRTLEAPLRLRAGANLIAFQGGMTIGPMALRDDAPEGSGCPR